MLKTFDFYRSNNARLHNRLNQQDQYTKYLKRIDKIVDKKPSQDTSTKFYMTFMNKTKYKARCHNTLEKQLIIGYQNKNLFQKIIKAKNRKNEKVAPTYSIAMHEKRFRQQEKINQQNKQIAKRITQQYSFLKNRSNKSINRYSPSSQGQSKSPNQKQAIISWHQQIKARRLPKLVNLRT